MKNFKITKEEKNIILEMHNSKRKKVFLEQEDEDEYNIFNDALKQDDIENQKSQSELPVFDSKMEYTSMLTNIPGVQKWGPDNYPDAVIFNVDGENYIIRREYVYCKEKDFNNVKPVTITRDGQLTQDFLDLFNKRSK